MWSTRGTLVFMRQHYISLPYMAFLSSLNLCHWMALIYHPPMWHGMETLRWVCTESVTFPCLTSHSVTLHHTLKTSLPSSLPSLFLLPLSSTSFHLSLFSFSISLPSLPLPLPPLSTALSLSSLSLFPRLSMCQSLLWTSMYLSPWPGLSEIIGNVGDTVEWINNRLTT